MRIMLSDITLSSRIFPAWLTALTLLAATSMPAAAEPPPKAPGPAPKSSTAPAPKQSSTPPVAPGLAPAGTARGIAPGPGAGLDDLRLLALTPASGDVAGLSTGPMTAGNSIEATFAYNLQTAERAQIGVFTTGVPGNPPHTSRLIPTEVARGSGRASVRFTVACAPGAIASLPIAGVRYRLAESDGRGGIGRTLAEGVQPVSFSFRCAAAPGAAAPAAGFAGGVIPDPSARTSSAAVVAADEVRLLRLSPASGDVAGAIGALNANNSVEVLLSYRLQSADHAQLELLTVNTTGNPPHTGRSNPALVARGSGELRMRFSIACGDGAAASVSIANLRYALTPRAADGRFGRTLVAGALPVNFVFHCAEPPAGERGMGARISTPAERPGVGGGPLSMPDLVSVLTNPMSARVVVRNIGNGPAGPSTLRLTCVQVRTSAAYVGCPEAEGFRDTDGNARIVMLDIPPLAEGQEHRLDLPFWSALRFSPGTYGFGATADYRNEVAERDETNNRAASALDVR